MFGAPASYLAAMVFWRVQQIESRPSQMDYTSSAQGRPTVTQLLADGEVIAEGDLGLPAEPTQGRLAPAISTSSIPAAAAAPAGTALPSYIEDLERKAIEEALQANRYNKTKAAAALGITFRALRYKLKKLGID